MATQPVTHPPRRRPGHHRHGQCHADHHRCHPRRQRRRYRIGHRADHQAEQAQPAVTAQQHRQRNAAVIALLGVPAGVLAGQYFGHAARLHIHHHRRHQGCQHGFQQHRQQRAESTAAAQPLVARGQHRHIPHGLGCQQHRHGQREHPQHAILVDAAPVIGRRQLQMQFFGQVDATMDQRDGNADQHQHGPHRRGKVMADADHHVHPADPVQARRGHHLGVLQVALAPASVADQQVGQGRRTLLVAALHVRHHVRGPAATPHQRRLDEIVAQHMAAERLAPGQFRQACLLGEGTRAYHRVVPPVIALRTVPPGHAIGHYRAIHPATELLHAGKGGAAVDHRRQRLDQADTGMVFHCRGQTYDHLTGHQAVGIQDQHLRVAATETTHPVGDVAGLAPDVAGTAPVEQPPGTAGGLYQLGKHLFLGAADGVAGGVAEHEEIKTVQLSGSGYRFVDRLQAGHHPARVFVVGGHQQCGAAAQGRQRRARHNAQLAAATQQGLQPRQAADERQGHPGEQQHEQPQQAAFEHVQAPAQQNLGHHPGGAQGHQRGSAEYIQTAQADVGRCGFLPGHVQLAGTQGLLGHRQGMLRRQDRDAGIQCVAINCLIHRWLHCGANRRAPDHARGHVPTCH